ncbi:oligosaccharide flippase family protein [Hydrogenophaga sp.]|uniref:oligosaccharide flippase family protein n=1 Tax=Hydrogenophaga sp. TaxID=1904254 RepID=UPI003D13657C
MTASAMAAKGENSALNAKARSGSIWIVGAFGASQVLRLGLNVVLAALLFEEAFALMAIVTAVMVGLNMFSDIGLQQNVVQSPRGDESAFLNTAWTMQVIRGIGLTLIAAAVAWPLATFYGTNDPTALELRWLIPLVALTAAIDGLRSPSALSAARHMLVARLTRIDVIVQISNAGMAMVLVWFMRSVYGIAWAGVLSSILYMVLTYWLLPGPRPRLMLERDAMRAIISFGKWIFLATLISFLAMQIDRLAFAAMYPLAEVGVYSIAMSLAMVVTALIGRLQIAVMFPWYSRMIESGMALEQAYYKAKMPMLIMSTYFVTLLIVGAGSFFKLAYDDRYAQAAVFLPILSVGIWFSSMGGMYGAAFLAAGRSKWIALVSAVKVGSFALLLVVLSHTDGSMAMATFAVLISELITFAMSRYLGWRLGLKSLRAELTNLVMLTGCSVVGVSLVHRFGPLAALHPAAQLLVLGVLTTLAFAPFFFKLVYPLLKQRGA